MPRWQDKDITDGGGVALDTQEKNNSVSDKDMPEGRTALEFEFSENSGFVFESEADISPELGEKTDDKAVGKTLADEEAVRELKEEFLLPDSYEVNEKYNTQSFLEDPMRVRTTYVPRFTEVSETYRMADDKRPRPTPKAQTASAPTKETEPSYPSVDPTAEIDEERSVEKVIVTQTHARTAEPSDESIKVFKFDNAKEESSRTSYPPSSEKTAFDSVSEERDVGEDDQALNLAQDTYAAPLEKDAKEYSSIPDPRDSLHVMNYDGMRYTDVTDEEAPAESFDDGKKRKSHVEFTSPIQRDTAKDRFLDSIMSVKVRLFAALFVLFSVLTVEILGLFNISLLSRIGLGTVGYADSALDLAFSCCLFLLALPEVIRAFRYLVRGELLPEISLPVSLFILIVYTAVVVAQSGITPEYMTFGILFAVQAVSAILGSLYRTTAEFASFKIISKNAPKNVFDKRYTRTLPRENIALDGVVDEYNSKTARMFRTAFVSDFFSRSSRVMENTVNVIMILGISLGIAVVTAVVSFFIADESVRLLTAAETLATVFMVAVPSFSILVHKLPLNHSIKEAESEDSTFVGEESIYEGADVDVIAYEDTEIFGIEDVSIKKVHLYGKVYNTPKAMKQMYSLFTVIGGPLDHLFSSSLDRKCSAATDVVIEDDGVSGMMDGHRICAGTEEYMLRHKISIPEEDYKTKTSATDSTKVMYGAEEGEVYVKFFIRYSFSEEFTMLLPDLKEKKIVPLIYTRDPNITVDLVRVLTLGEDIIRVMKKYNEKDKDEKIYRRVSAGIVTLGDKSNAINMVLLAKKYTSFQDSLATGELVSMIVGAVLAAVLSVVFVNNMQNIPVLALGIWQLALCAVLYVRSRVIFKLRKKEKGN